MAEGSPSVVAAADVAAAAAAAMDVAAADVAAAVPPVAAPVGIGVVGLGEIGQVHMRGFQHAPEVARVRAVTDLDPALRRAAASATGAAERATLAELLGDERVDALSVCVPHSLHREVALAAIAAGKHVLLEKPMAVTAAECEEIVVAAARAGVRVGVSHNQLFYPPHVRACQLLHSGALGRPLLLRMRLGIGGKLGGWRADSAASGGGLLFDAGVHRFYLARALCGEVCEIAAMADAPRARGEDLAVVLLRFASGALGTIEVNYHCPRGAFDDAIEICASAGILYISGCEADYEGFRTGPALRRYDGAWHEERVAPGGWEESVHASVQAFARALVQGEPPPVDGDEGRAVVALIERVYALT
ncbi:MAG TPA: Gfo/Idh/MocA family oxidoreductase [Solirubrobacteraceae bacterium]|jgi:predicted dehydrogenase|nr:Gfo/Idh/MocA family oxidoreductase [Solirubrobacteraceae bacterium]